MSFSIPRSNWPQCVLSLLPATLFFPVGIVYVGVLIFLLAFLLSADFKEKWSMVRRSPLFFPVLGLSLVSTVAALFLERPAGAFWSGYAHYQTYLFLLIFISVGAGQWQRRAVNLFLSGALVSATLFYLNSFGMLPAAHAFHSYTQYLGNKSILLGILLGIAGPWMLYELIAETDRRWFWLRIAAFLYVAVALLFFAKTRTGNLIFFLLCLMIAMKYVTLSRRNILGVGVMVLVLAVTWQYATDLRARVINTVSDVNAFVQGKQISDEGIRLEIYETTAKIVAEKPLMGHGIATWLSRFQARVQGPTLEGQTTPHNDYLLYATEIGLIGLAALLWIWLTQLQTAWRIGGDRGMWLGMLGVAMMVGGMFNAILRDALFGMPFMILLAIPLAGVTRPECAARD